MREGDHVRQCSYTATECDMCKTTVDAVIFKNLYVKGLRLCYRRSIGDEKDCVVRKNFI